MPSDDPLPLQPSVPSAAQLADALLAWETPPSELLANYADSVPLANGRYLLAESLGAGGMGRVFRALDTHTNSEVAVKLLNESLQQNADYLARFREEAALLAKCEHPHVVRYLDSGEDPLTGGCYIVMELMAGTVQEWLNRPIPLSRTITWIRAALQALAHAHALGISHRDIKPSNLLLTRNGTLKVGDFGVAFMIESPSSPESVADRSLSFATDLHDLGLVFYALSTGRIPRVNPLLPSQAAPLPRLCDTIFDRATTEDPARQYASAAAMDAAMANLEFKVTQSPWVHRLLVASAAAAVLVLIACAWIFYPKTSLDPNPQPTARTAVATPATGLQKLNALTPADAVSTASLHRPFTTADGHHFLPIPTVDGVLLDATEIRRSQFQKFTATLNANTTAQLLPDIFDLDGINFTRSTHPWTDTCPLPDDAAGGINVLAAEAYCQWLTAQCHANGSLPATAYFRLPWAAEWYAAAGYDLAALAQNPWPLNLVYPWGEQWPPPAEAGNFAGRETADDPLRPTWPMLYHRDKFPRVAPAGSFLQNPNGFYDMEANVCEWAQERPTTTEHAAPARIMLGFSWVKGDASQMNPLHMGYDYSTSGTNGVGFRIALEYAPPTQPRLLVTLHRISDTTGSPNTANPGTAQTKFRHGYTVRITWQLQNFGTPANVIVRNSANSRPMTAPWHGGATTYRGPGKTTRTPALGGGINQTATIATDQSQYFSFDMDTTTWPVDSPICMISATIVADTPDQPRLESSAPGAALPWISPQWWLEAFILKER